MSTLIARKLAKRAPWLPHGAQEYLNLRAGTYWTGDKARGSLADALAAAGFSFARASQAAYFNKARVLSTASSGAPRLDTHPVTGATLGLLLERAMTPINLNPEALDNAYWTKSGSVTIDANADVAPDGATSADRLRPPSGTSSTYNVLRGTLAVVNGSKYTVSAFIKPSAIGYAFVGFNYSSALKGGWIDIVNAVPATAFSGAPAAKPIGNGFVRSSAVHTISGVSSTQIYIAPCTSDGSLSFAGDNVKYMDVWGIQLEQGDYATSYNAGTARVADSLTRTIGTPARLCRVIGFTAPPGLATNVVWQMDGGSEANRIRLVRDGSGNVRLIVTASSAETVNINLGAVANESFNRVAVMHDGSRFRAVLNANPVLQTAVAAIPAVTTERLGSSATAGEELNGWLAEFAAYDGLADGGLIEASRVFPVWVLTDAANQPADLFGDHINNRYWANGLAYPTFAAMMTAIGATVTSTEKWVFPFVDASVTFMWEGMTGDAKTSGVSHVFMQVDNGTTQYERLYLGGGVNAVGVDCFYGVSQYNAENPEIKRKYDTTRYAVTFNSSDFSASWEGSTPSTGSTPPTRQTSGAIITAPLFLRFGDDAAGTRPITNATKTFKFAVFKAPKAPADVAAIGNAHFPIVAAGDSYMAGSFSASMPASFARIENRLIKNIGVGGATLATQAGLALSLIAAWPSAIFCFWDGKSNGYGTLAADQAYYTSMANACIANGNTKFILYAPVSSIYDLDPVAVARQKALSAWLRATWPNNSVDIVEYAATLGLTGNDAADIAANLTPRSWFRVGDEPHMLETVHDAIHTNVTMPLINAAGWLAAA